MIQKLERFKIRDTAENDNFYQKKRNGDVGVKNKPKLTYMFKHTSSLPSIKLVFRPSIPKKLDKNYQHRHLLNSLTRDYQLQSQNKVKRVNITDRGKK